MSKSKHTGHEYGIVKSKIFDGYFLIQGYQFENPKENWFSTMLIPLGETKLEKRCGDIWR